MSAYYTETEKAELFNEVVSLVARIDVRRAEIEQTALANETMFNDIRRASIGSFCRHSVTSNEAGGVRYLRRVDGFDGLCGFPAVLKDVLKDKDKYDFDAEGIFSIYERMTGVRDSGYGEGRVAYEAMGHICCQCKRELESAQMHPLLIMTGFLNEFVCLMPFSEYMAEMLEILTCWFLNMLGYGFVSCIQSERKELENICSRMVLSAECLNGNLTWNEKCFNLKEILFWVEHGQKQVLERVYNYGTGPAVHRRTDPKKRERILGIISASDRPISKREIADFLADVSDITVNMELHGLCKEGTIERLGSTRMATYRKALADIYSGGEDIEQ